MWGSKKSGSWPSTLFWILLVTPLVVIALIACDFGPQKSVFSSFGLTSFDFFSSISLNSVSLQGRVSSNVSDERVVSNDSLEQELRDEEQLIRPELSSAQRRGFLPSGLHKRYSRSEKIELALARVRFSIRKAARKRSIVSSTNEEGDSDVDVDHYVPSGPIYQNANAFYRSYQEMEKLFKIYVYEEGEAPIFHQGPCRSIYSTEGRFIHEMERGNHFRTKDPEEAHVFFMPYSVSQMVRYVYTGTIDMDTIGHTIIDYVNTISHKHRFWNRSLGSDHFMLSCHDWGSYSSRYVPLLVNNSIRVLCNANTSEGFNPLKDATLPEINLKTGEITGLIGGPPPSERTILAFFAGGLHGHIRQLLLSQWKEKDPDVRVYERLPKEISYEGMLRNSKYCLCPSGWEVASPRLVEAIYGECVPVLISKSYIPPFSDVLNWKAFSVIIAIEDIPNIKKILLSIPEARYLEMQKRVKQVQKHFVINGTPKRYDLFHMIVHSVWLRRLNIRLHESSM